MSWSEAHSFVIEFQCVTTTVLWVKCDIPLSTRPPWRARGRQRPGRSGYRSLRVRSVSQYYRDCDTLS